MDLPVVPGNPYDKYHSRNPLARVLMWNYLRCLHRVFTPQAGDRVLEAGCGEGYLLQELRWWVHHRPSRYVGVDLSHPMCRQAHQGTGVSTVEARIEELPFLCDAFDWVLLCEVLEHVTLPNMALLEAKMFCRGTLIVSVPHEPWYSVLNLLRGAHWPRWGSPPGHQHRFYASGPRGIRRPVNTYFQVKQVLYPFPWVMLVAERRRWTSV